MHAFQDPRSLGPFVRRAYLCLIFGSTAEAKRRAALLAALGHEPLSAFARVISERRGVPRLPLFLFTLVRYLFI